MRLKRCGLGFGFKFKLHVPTSRWSPNGEHFQLAYHRFFSETARFWDAVLVLGSGDWHSHGDDLNSSGFFGEHMPVVFGLTD